MLRLATRRSVPVHQPPARWRCVHQPPALLRPRFVHQPPARWRCVHQPPAPLRPRFVSPPALPRSIAVCSEASRDSGLAATGGPLFAPSLSLLLVLLVKRSLTRLRSTIRHPPFTLPPKFRLSTEPILSDLPSLMITCSGHAWS